MKYVTFAIIWGILAMFAGVASEAPSTYTGKTLIERMAGEPTTQVNRIKSAIEAE